MTNENENQTGEATGQTDASGPTIAELQAQADAAAAALAAAQAANAVTEPDTVEQPAAVQRLGAPGERDLVTGADVAGKPVLVHQHGVVLVENAHLSVPVIHNPETGAYQPVQS